MSETVVSTVELVQRDDEWLMVPLVEGKPRDFMSHAHYPVHTPLFRLFEDAERLLHVPAGRVHLRREIS